MGRGRTVAIGDKFGSFTVASEVATKSNDGHRQYRCVCDCGHESVIHSGNLRSLKRNGKVCAHTAGLPANEMIGKRFGDLVVVGFSHSDKHNKANWLCKCSCGESAVIATGTLRKGQKSCGCKQGAKPSIEIGREYGWLTAIAWAEHKNAFGSRMAIFRCRCGSTKTLIASMAATNRTISCGCAIRGAFLPVRPASVRIEHANSAALRKRGGVADYTKDDIARLFVRQRGCCAACRKKTPLAEMQRDHVVAIAIGGKNTLHNLQLLCRSCNSSKGAKDPIVFMQSRGYLL